jgi:phage tail protein X
LVAAIALSLSGKLSVPQGVSKPVETVQSLFQTPLRTEAKDAGLVKTEAPQAAGVAENPGIRIVIAKEGDSVSQIILREFGRVDVRLLEAVKKLNPEIEDVNRIVGHEIKLPSDPEEAYKNPGAPSYFSIHLASFRHFNEANRLFNKLIEIGEKPTIIPANIKGSAWYRVTIGEYEDSTGASVNAKRLVQSGQFGYAKPLKIPDL